MAAARDRLVGAVVATQRRRRSPGPPTWPRNPRQDSFGNPTTKRSGDVNTELKYSGKWRDRQGALGPKRRERRGTWSY